MLGPKYRGEVILQLHLELRLELIYPPCPTLSKVAEDDNEELEQDDCRCELEKPHLVKLTVCDIPEEQSRRLARRVSRRFARRAADFTADTTRHARAAVGARYAGHGQPALKPTAA